MNTNRTMVTLTARDNFISIRTVDKQGVHSPGNFYINREKFVDLAKNNGVIARDGFSFCDMSVSGTELCADISWLNNDGSGRLTGHREALRLDWTKVRDFALDAPATKPRKMRMLSNVVASNPKLVIESRENFKKVLADKEIRHKFAKFVSNNFHYVGAKEIRLYDDFVPYSFFFREVRKDGREGLCGGLILHNRDDVRSARYCIHT